jgi:PKD domain/Secretion system C-terminal sorting domain
MRKYFKYIFVLLSLITSFQLITAQIVNIPDANFKAYLVGNSAINTNLDTEIQVSEATAFSGTINVASLSIANLTGIETFTALTALNISQNPITSVDLSSNTALTSISFAFTPMTCLDLSYNTAMTYIEGSSNSLQKLNVKNGNNNNVTYFVTSGSSTLSCIQVDNVAYSNTNWVNIDGSSFFSTDCGQPVASFTSNAPVCLGTAVDFTNTSLSSTSYTWDFGDGANSIVTSPSHVFPSVGNYNTVLSAYNCYGTDIASATIVQGKSISGNATYTGGPVTNGWALLYAYEPFYIAFDTLQIRPLDAAGFYQFNNVAEGDYLIQIFPDTTMYPSLMPTYHTNQWFWDSATVVNQACTVDAIADVTMAEITPSSPGSGLLQGYVVEGPGFGRAQGDPVHGVVVKRGITSTSQIVETTVTDLGGFYSFENVEFGTYTIFVDIPGLLRDSTHTVTVDGTNNQFLDLSYMVDSMSIFISPYIGIEDMENDPNSTLAVFPNPIMNNAIIHYTCLNNAQMSLDIYNILGEKIQTLYNNQQEAGDYTFEFNADNTNLLPGVYLLSLTADSYRKTIKIMVIE